MSEIYNLWEPTKEWDGGEAFLIGGGPSLRGFDFSLLAGRNVIGCNDAFNLGSHIVGICLFGDPSWWQKNKWKIEKFDGRLVTNAPTCFPFKLDYLLKMKRKDHGLGGGDTLGWNYSTGAAAIDLAIILGAKKIYLLGYDLQSPNGVHHWHNHNPNTRIHESSFLRFMRGFEDVKKALPKGVKIWNVTDGTSRLECFSKISFQEFDEVVSKLAVFA